jgi:hypothetical protein
MQYDYQTKNSLIQLSNLKKKKFKNRKEKSAFRFVDSSLQMTEANTCIVGYQYPN